MKKTIANKGILTLLGLALILAGVFTTRSAMACSSEPYLATMCVFAGNFAPRGYAFAQGQLLPISSNTALFSLLGTTYGGDGRTTFALPDTRGRVLVGAGNGPGLSNYILGQKGGAETVTLTTAQIPAHTHSARAKNLLGNSSSPSNTVWAQVSEGSRVTGYSTQAPDVSLNAAAISNTGGGQAHENRMPYLVINWIIALQGIFPSRS
jgi:microcystin-dependent protein